MYLLTHTPQTHTPWNKCKLVGQKPPLKLKEIWEIRIRLQIANRIRDLAMFDLVKLKIRDIAHGSAIAKRAMVMQQKTRQPVQFEITEQTRDAVSKWIDFAKLTNNDYLFKSQFKSSPHLSTRQYARIVESWVAVIGLDPTEYGAHSLRRSKASLIYKRTKNLRAVQLLLGHTKLESTVRYLGIEVDDALEMAEQTDV